MSETNFPPYLRDEVRQEITTFQVPGQEVPVPPSPEVQGYAVVHKAEQITQAAAERIRELQEQAQETAEQEGIQPVLEADQETTGPTPEDNTPVEMRLTPEQLLHLIETYGPNLQQYRDNERARVASLN